VQLSWYINDSQTLLHDNLGLLVSVPQLTRWINEARNQVAYQTGCVSRLASGKAPYGNQANAGYMVPGGATPGSPFKSSFRTIVNQEKYPFSMALDQLKKTAEGIDEVIDITSIACSWGSMRPAMNFMPWPDLQAYARSYNFLVTSFPLVWSTDNDGSDANVWLFPVPSISEEMEWQCTCKPTPLVTDADYDAIPHPFNNSVKYYAAYLSYLSTMRPQTAEIYYDMFMQALRRGRGATDQGRVTSWYDY
jgi:hypothetical protein